MFKAEIKRKVQPMSPDLKKKEEGVIRTKQI
jgi:hypothetical protein